MPYALCLSPKNLIPERLLGELGQHKGRLVHLLAVVPEKLVLLLGGPAANGLLDVDGAVLAAHHEADLAGGVGGDGGPAVLGDGEDLLALLLQAGDHGHVEPGVLGCEMEQSVHRVLKSRVRLLLLFFLFFFGRSDF
jgi:hypothetical protein